MKSVIAKVWAYNYFKGHFTYYVYSERSLRKAERRRSTQRIKRY